MAKLVRITEELYLPADSVQGVWVEREKETYCVRVQFVGGDTHTVNCDSREQAVAKAAEIARVVNGGEVTGGRVGDPKLVEDARMYAAWIESVEARCEGGDRATLEHIKMWLRRIVWRAEGQKGASDDR